MKKYDFFTRDLLEDLYLNQKLSIKNIAEMYNVKEFTIHNLLTKFNINRKQDFRRIDLDEDTLYQLYVIEKKSVSEIKSLLGYCEQTIRRYLKYFNIDNQYINYTNEQLVNLYTIQRKSLSQINSITRIPKSRIRNILISEGLQLRDRSSCQSINIEYGDKFVDFDYNTLKSQSRLKRKCQSFFKNHIAQKVKQLRGSKCELCGSDINLHAHHIYPQSLIISNIIKENPDKSEEELYKIIIKDSRFLDMTNIKVVCESCHYTVYHPYVNYNRDYKQISSLAQKQEGSTTIENALINVSEQSTLQANGNGSAEHPNKKDDDIV